jgi:hypothetical protein
MREYHELDTSPALSIASYHHNASTKSETACDSEQDSDEGRRIEYYVDAQNTVDLDSDVNMPPDGEDEEVAEEGEEHEENEDEEEEEEQQEEVDEDEEEDKDDDNGKEPGTIGHREI